MDSELLDFGPDDVTGGWRGYDERLPRSHVGGAFRVLGRGVHQRLPVHGAVVVLVDEHPDLVVWIGRVLSEKYARAGVVVELWMRVLVFQDPREKSDGPLVVLLADRELLGVDLTFVSRSGSDRFDVGHGFYPFVL